MKLPRKARFLVLDIANAISPSRMNEFLAHEAYRIGFTGNGPSMLESPPPFKKPWLPRFIRRWIREDFDTFAEEKRQIFRQVCIEILGEDPEEDWNETPPVLFLNLDRRNSDDTKVN